MFKKFSMLSMQKKKDKTSWKKITKVRIIAVVPFPSYAERFKWPKFNQSLKMQDKSLKTTTEVVSLSKNDPIVGHNPWSAYIAPAIFGSVLGVNEVEIVSTVAVASIAVVSRKRSHQKSNEL